MKKEDIKLTISTGNTLIDNLSGYLKVGTIVHLLGPSQSGKSLEVCEILYAAIKQYQREMVEVGYNNAEGGFDFPTMDMYGYDISDSFRTTETMEGLLADFTLFCEQKKKDTIGIYVVDSLDGIGSKEEQKFQEEIKKAMDKGEELPDIKSYRGGRAKAVHEFFRKGNHLAEDNNVLLIIISQLKDNMTGFGKKWTYTGQRPLSHFPTTQLFFEQVEYFGDKEFDDGFRARVHGLKTRNSTHRKTVYISVNKEIGICDVEGNIDYLFDLVDEGGKLNPTDCQTIIWKKGTKEYSKSALKEFIEENNLMQDTRDMVPSGRYMASNALSLISSIPDMFEKFVDTFGVMDRETLVRYIESNDLEEELIQRVNDKWKEDEVLHTKPRKRKVL